ncbi:hypothetical protein [Pectobacterium brasiliense]|uniref:hypothetical protein n=1 Tax=Pectobacterium brasiliense TaxID=180957 RepID=UPI003987325F
MHAAKSQLLKKYVSTSLSPQKKAYTNDSDNQINAGIKKMPIVDDLFITYPYMIE